MTTKDFIVLDGTVVNINRDLFIVETDNCLTIACKLSGKIRTNNIRIVVADRVKIEISPYDTTKGRIVTRL